MKLSFDEETILILYAEFYRKLYKAPKKNEDTTFKHSDVQSLIYLIQQLVHSHLDYCFTWNCHGPFSPNLEALLIQLDKKEELCDLFYQKYLPQRLFKSTNAKMIEEYYPSVYIEKIEQAIVVLNDIIEEYGTFGCELMASLLYIAKTVFPGWGFDVIEEELKHRENKFDNEELIKKAWHCLGILSLINKNNLWIKDITNDKNFLIRSKDK